MGKVCDREDGRSKLIKFEFNERQGMKMKEVHGEFPVVYPKATMWIALNKALFAQLMYALVNEVSSGEVETAATSGNKRFFDKTFMDSMAFKQQAFIMCHEIMHEMLMHIPRRQGRDHRLWNYVCDIKVNNLLVESGFDQPSGGVFDHHGETFRGKSEEFIYDFIEEEVEKGGAGVPDKYVEDLSSEEMSGNDIAQAMGRLQNAVEMHGHGALPAELRGIIGNILDPKERWFDTLRKYFTSRTFSGCDWNSMSRREYARTGLVAPPFQSDSLGTVVISVDQSGSISQDMLDHFSGHINSILTDCRPQKVVTQYFDTKVHATDEFSVDDLPITLRHVRGGGTSFVDCCAKAEEYEATVHLILTDMEGEMPEGSTIPTIWADFMCGHEAPFGEYIVITMD